MKSQLTLTPKTKLEYEPIEKMNQSPLSILLKFNHNLHNEHSEFVFREKLYSNHKNKMTEKDLEKQM